GPSEGAQRTRPAPPNDGISRGRRVPRAGRDRRRAYRRALLLAIRLLRFRYQRRARARPDERHRRRYPRPKAGAAAADTAAGEEIDRQERPAQKVEVILGGSGPRSRAPPRSRRARASPGPREGREPTGPPPSRPGARVRYRCRARGGGYRRRPWPAGRG